ncbi:hypothetical protein OAJ56_01585 [Flavobacteriales bacterium]|nr:hypothetical protein [Flavobacteriales bacterium]
MENKKSTKVIVVLYSSLGIVFSTYVIINIIKGFQDFDDVIFSLYFATTLSSSYFYKDLLKKKSVQYPFIIMCILFIIFLVKTYLI